LVISNLLFLPPGPPRRQPGESAREAAQRTRRGNTGRRRGAGRPQANTGLQNVGCAASSPRQRGLKKEMVWVRSVWIRGAASYFDRCLGHSLGCCSENREVAEDFYHAALAAERGG